MTERLSAESVVVPRSLLFKLYRTWLDHHGCYAENCTCNETIATVQALLRYNDGSGAAQ